MAIWVPWARVLLAGDYLSSSVEIPTLGDSDGRAGRLSGDARAAAPAGCRAERIVPGHGPVLDPARALAVLEEDLAYLRALGELGAGPSCPLDGASRSSGACTKRTPPGLRAEARRGWGHSSRFFRKVMTAPS